MFDSKGLTNVEWDYSNATSSSLLVANDCACEQFGNLLKYGGNFT